MVATVGRYNVNRAPIPGELPGEGSRHTRCTIKHGAVADPNPTFRGQLQRAAINIKTDALEFEYARGRISEAGYWAAKTYAAVLEKSRSPISGRNIWDIGSRVDQVVSHELGILSRIVRAQDATAMLADTAPVIGMLGQRILELVLMDAITIGEAAKRLAPPTEDPESDAPPDRQAVIYWARRFRESCELLAEHWCGPRRRAPRI